MADNLNITAGTGTVIATDQVGTDHYQRIKLTDGLADVATPINADIGAKANALRVCPANDITDATYIGDIKFGEALVAGTALIGKVGIDQVSANANEVVVKSGTVTTVSTVTNLAQMNGTAIAMNEGVLAAGVQRVTLATDDDGVAHLSTIATNTARVAITDYGQAKLDSADVTVAQVLVAAVAAKKFYITSLILSVAAAGSYWIEDDAAAQITCKYTLAANGGVAIQFPIDTPYKSTTANSGLKVKGSVAGVIGCQITYYTLA